MIGTRTGSKAGVYGSKVGSSADDEGSSSDPMAGVTRDATDNRFYPATAGEWTTTLAAAALGTGGPFMVCPMQDAAAPAVDVVGGFNLAAAGSPTFNQAVAGVSRKGVTFDNASTDALSNAAGTLPTLGSESLLVLMIIRAPAAAPAAARAALSIGGAGTRFVAQVNTTPRWEARHSANVATGTANAADNALHLVALRHKATATTEADGYTDAEKLSPTFSAVVAGQGIILGNAGNPSPDMQVVYLAAFRGAAAELTDAQFKTLAQTLGWTIAW